jgi:hypothetical protein
MAAYGQEYHTQNDQTICIVNPRNQCRALDLVTKARLLHVYAQHGHIDDNYKAQELPAWGPPTQAYSCAPDGLTKSACTQHNKA